MKKLYWRPQRVSLRVLGLLAVVSIGGLVSVEVFKVRERQPYFKEKMEAARLTLRAFETIKQEKRRLGIPVDVDADPTGSGLIGVLLSPVTTNPGHLPSKQTSVNPNFAAVIVHWLKRAGVEEGDYVAVGMSGSFPTLNMATMAAIEVLKAKPIIVTSVGSSQWGANDTSFLWPDMERVLIEKRVFNMRSTAMSRGGIEDRALGLSRQGRQILDAVLQRSGTTVLDVKSYDESVERRVALYREVAGNGRLAAYVNVGGGTTSVGTHVGKKMFKPGLNRDVPRGLTDIDSVMTRLSLDGIPIVHISQIDSIAQQWGLPLQPKTMPAVGDGAIYVRQEYNRWLAGGLLALILLLAVAFVRMDWGYRLLTGGKREPPAARPEPTV